MVIIHNMFFPIVEVDMYMAHYEKRNEVTIFAVPLYLQH